MLTSRIVWLGGGCWIHITAIIDEVLDAASTIAANTLPLFLKDCNIQSMRVLKYMDEFLVFRVFEVIKYIAGSLFLSIGTQPYVY